MNIETAVIPVAGIGSRQWPAATTIEKSLLPVYVGDRAVPIVDYMVDECVKAGIRRIIFVTTERGRVQLKNYFEELSPTHVAYARTLGKAKLLQADLDRRAAYKLQYEYIIQPTDVYGTAVPLWLAHNLLAGEKTFAFTGGDDFIRRNDHKSELALAIQTYQSSGTDHLIMGLPIAREKATHYGVLEVDEHQQLVHIREKPLLEDLLPEQPTPVINITRYLFNDGIWQYLETNMKQKLGDGEEHGIVEVIQAALDSGQTFHVHRVSGRYLDGGRPAGMREASEFLTANPDYR